MIEVEDLPKRDLWDALWFWLGSKEQRESAWPSNTLFAIRTIDKSELVFLSHTQNFY